MKRILMFVVLLCLVAVGAYAHSALTIRPSEMKDGETKVFEEDGRKITVKKDGNTLSLRIDGAGATKTLTIVGDGGDVRIHGFDGRTFVFPDRLRERIVIDGVPGLDLDNLPRYRALPRQKLQSWFVCPKDKTMLRVPEESDEKEFTCPVDGTKMEKRRAHGFQFFFDDADDHDV